MCRPKQCGKHRPEVTRKFLVTNGLVENRNAKLAVLFRYLAERGARVNGFAGITEKDAENFPVALENVQFSVEGGLETFLQIEFCRGESFDDSLAVLLLHTIVIREEDGLFAGEVVV